MRQQFLEELAKKSTGEADADKAKKDEKAGVKEDESEKRLLEKGFSVINTDTLHGIVSSAGSMDLVAKAHEQYVKAEIRQDGKAMSSAMKFQTSFARQAVNDAAEMQSSKAETSKDKATAVAAYKNTAKPDPEDKKSSPLEIFI